MRAGRRILAALSLIVLLFGVGAHTFLHADSPSPSGVSLEAAVDAAHENFCVLCAGSGFQALDSQLSPHFGFPAVDRDDQRPALLSGHPTRTTSPVGSRAPPTHT